MVAAVITLGPLASPALGVTLSGGAAPQVLCPFRPPSTAHTVTQRFPLWGPVSAARHPTPPEQEPSASRLLEPQGHTDPQADNVLQTGFD